MSVVTASLLPGLRRLGLDVCLVDTADRRGLRNIGSLDLQNVLGALRHGAEFVGRALAVRPDVVYVPISQNRLGFLRDSLFLIPARLLRTPVVVHLHGCAFDVFYRRQSVAYRWLVRLCLSRATAAIVLGPAALRQFVGILPQERVRIVPNGVAGTAPVHDAARPWALGTDDREGEFLVLYLSALHPQKGFLDLLDAIPLLDDLEGVRFVLAGELSTAEAEQCAAQKLSRAGFRGRVDVPGPVDQHTAAELLRSAAVLVLPAIWAEGQPLCILEAFSAGVPVITTRRGCIVDTVVDGWNGTFVDAGSPEQIAQAIRSFFADRERLRRMSDNARRSYEERYTLPLWQQSVADVLTEAAGSGLR